MNTSTSSINNNNNNNLNLPQQSYRTATHCINEGTNTVEVNTVNVSTYANSTCPYCQEKEMMIATYKLKTEQYKKFNKELQDAKRRMTVYSILGVFGTILFFVLIQCFYFFF